MLERLYCSFITRRVQVHVCKDLYEESVGITQLAITTCTYLGTAVCCVVVPRRDQITYARYRIIALPGHIQEDGLGERELRW